MTKRFKVDEKFSFTKKLLYSSFILALCTICLFASTLAWFGINRRTRGGGLDISIGGLEVDYTMSIYKNGDTSNPVAYEDVFSGMIPGEFYTFVLTVEKTKPHALDLRVALRDIEDEEIVYFDQDGIEHHTGKYTSQLFTTRLVSVNGTAYDENASTINSISLKDYSLVEDKNIVVLPNWSEDNEVTISFEIKLIEDYNDPAGLDLYPSWISNSFISIGHLLIYGFEVLS